MGTRLKAALKAGIHYAGWYPTRYLPISKGAGQVEHPRLRRHCKKIAKRSRQLSRALFQSMMWYGPKLERRQLLLGRYVDIAAELFAMSVSVSRAQSLLTCNDSVLSSHALDNAIYICKRGHQRIDTWFKECKNAPDDNGYKLAQSLMKEV